MKSTGTVWTIVGQGLAGTCLAWELWRRDVGFNIVDSGKPGSSRMAAGMINPITGKNFEPSWRIEEFLPAAVGLYHLVEAKLGIKIWHPMPVLRLAATEHEFGKMQAKSGLAEVTRWVSGVVSPPSGWIGAVELQGGGWVDTRAFLDASRQFFQSSGRYDIGHLSSVIGPHEIRCEGAAGLLDGSYGPHRCAKGEILTIRAPGWDESHIQVGGGGWLVPVGEGIFRVGSTYDWTALDHLPTPDGRAHIAKIAERFGGADYEVIAHDAAVRPILRRSQPLIGRFHEGWMFNALGSKGTLYAPGMADRLADWMIENKPPEPVFDFASFTTEG